MSSPHSLDELLRSPPSSRYVMLSKLAMGCVGLLLLWALVARLDEVAVAAGEVVPQEQIQAVQHLEGGIIEKILVMEGNSVKKGQPLIQLSLTNSTTNRDELEIQQQALELKRTRLEAQSQGKEALEYGDKFKDYRPNLIATEMQAFAGWRERLDGSLKEIKEQTEQRKLDVTQIETERESVSSNLEVLREKLKISEDLIRDKLTPKIEHLQLKSEVQELEGKLKIIEVAIPRSKAALKEAEEKYNNEMISFRNQATQELSQVEADIARTQELMTRATDKVERNTITSPIDGTVKSLRTHTIGGVLQPGETAMEIVPSSENLIIEAKLSPNDIGFVKVGQKALVKVLPYDYARYGGLEGEVFYVSADSHTDRTKGDTYFMVKVRTDKTYLGSEKGQMAITPGMPATADIMTGSKTVMQYLLKPIIRLRNESFRER